MITPQVIADFVSTHMASPNHSIEDTLLYPKFVIRTVGTRCTNDVKIYFSKEPMLQDAMLMWGSGDMAIQRFVKQRHLNRGASLLRYHANRSGGIFKASVLNSSSLNGYFQRYHAITGGIIVDHIEKQRMADKMSKDKS